MTRRSLAASILGIAFAGTAFAVSDSNTITFNISGASDIAVLDDITFNITASATPTGLTFSDDGPKTTTVDYTSVTGNSETISVNTTDALPSGLDVDIAANYPGLDPECGTGGSVDLETGGTIISGIDNGIGCNATLTYTLNITDAEVDPAQNATAVTVTYTLSES